MIISKVRWLGPIVWCTSYDPLSHSIHYTIPTRIQTIIHSRYLARVPAPRYYIYVYTVYYMYTVIRARAFSLFSVHSCDKYLHTRRRLAARIPRRWNIIFARDTPAGKFWIRVTPPAACTADDPSHAFVLAEAATRDYSSAFTLMIRRRFVGSHAPLRHPRHTASCSFY